MAETSSINRREQLRHLNNSLISGCLTVQEYDELRPFVSPTFQSHRQNYATRVTAQAQQPSDTNAAASNEQQSAVRRNVRFAEDVVPPPPVEAPPQYQILATLAASVSTGLQLRCPVCSTSNDTARSRHCYVCNSRLMIINGLPAAAAARRLGTRGSTGHIVPPTTDAFTLSDAGHVMFCDGFFSCVVQNTQTIATREGKTCQVFVMCCTWRPRQVIEDGRQQTEATWYVSQRFSNFEKLHKRLKKRLSRSIAVSLPPFPAKYHLTDRLEKRKQGLTIYMPRLLEMCAILSNAQPELDEFLDISHQIRLFLSQHPNVATASTVSSSMPAEYTQQTVAPTSSTAVPTSFSEHAGSAMFSAQSVAPPMDEIELAQAEGAVKLLAQAVRKARGDVRTDGIVQHHLNVCVQLAPGLQRSADLENPFASAELIPRAMQCEEDLHQAVAMYNDSLLAASGVTPSQQQVRHPEPHVQAQHVPVRNVVPASAA
ncbi:unnamed protein product [Peronospora belbahrii]|uniref:PX domain-containing protein n=1 Tax=Peronospora belbahrii TaxID=622444 RepID=A0AAU9L652_9STRA|nr:unnamed protein product [Peronospora belbahrii]CAH0517292.1 unnamed protein product [Peronospora belbahrii]